MIPNYKRFIKHDILFYDIINYQIKEFYWGKILIKAIIILLVITATMLCFIIPFGANPLIIVFSVR